MTGAVTLRSPTELAEALNGVGYLPDEGLATVAYLSYVMRRPLFLEGDPGVGKTEFARALARVTGTPLLRLQCYEGIDRRQALYDWNFPRQMLHLRLAADLAATDGPGRDELEESLYADRFLIKRPILEALTAPSTLLIDEIDRADDEFEAFLLEVLSDFSVTIPELKPVIRAPEGQEPWVVITSNRTREVHDALKRRCLYHWVNHPELEREVAIIRNRVPEAGEQLVREAAKIAAMLRAAGLQKPPGIAETIDWVTAQHRLGYDTVEPVTARNTLGALLKYGDDIARAATLPGLAGE